MNSTAVNIIHVNIFFFLQIWIEITLDLSKKGKKMIEEEKMDV